MSNWQNKVEVKKGNIGEELVEKRLIKLGFIPYQPSIDGPHPIDRLYIKNDASKQYMVEVKCKELRKLYPDTGFPIRNLEKYIKINKLIPVNILFVDYIKGEIYGNLLDKLLIEKNDYPLKIDGIVYFKYSSMKVFDKLTQEEIQLVKSIRVK